MKFFEKPKEGSVITFEDELTHVFNPPKPTEDERTDMKIIVNSDQYKSLKNWLLKYAMGFYRDARGFKDSRTHMLNELGKQIELIVTAMDSYREKAEDTSEPDPYDV